MTRKWVFLVPVLVPLLFLATISTLDFNFFSYYVSSYCPSNNSVNWVITSGRLNLVQKTALESIFVHNPNVCLNIYIKEKMDDTIGILHDIKRLQNDGFLIFILQYNFKALVDETMAVTQAVPTHVVDQFLKRFPIYEKGEFWAYSHESNFVRLLVLLQHGGVYLDTDIVLVKSLKTKSFRNSIAYEMEDGGRLNNNVLIFDPHHWFLVACLQEMFNNYSPSVYEANGPQLITRVFNSLAGSELSWNVGWSGTILDEPYTNAVHTDPDKRDVKVLLADTFQPVNWPWDHPQSEEYRHIIEKNAVGVHLNNRLTRNFDIRKGTLAYNILAGNCLHCDGLVMDKEV